jgi:H+-transporting ATPase
LAASTIALYAVAIYTSFFEDSLGVEAYKDGNGREMHMVIYLQVAMISQALIFITRSHGFFFMERPSFALMGAFVLAQVISSIIAAYANWGFTDIAAISGGWIGIVWVWVSFIFDRGESSHGTLCLTMTALFLQNRTSFGSCL